MQKFKTKIVYLSKTSRLKFFFFEKSGPDSNSQVASLMISFYLPYVWLDFQVNDLVNLDFHQAVYAVVFPVHVMDIPLVIYFPPGEGNTYACHSRWSIVGSSWNLSGSETSITIANQLPWRNLNKMYTSINYKIIPKSAGKK